ncbi:membrane protein [Helicobacter cinaedi]|uniref:YqaA family protein n=1 Tax=Helicobacter cinaedi TaxID=213 RepID=UPI001F1C5B15|nr:VTT domain-containing protein [Helicobacter cinaedi]BDB67125.1 membrane protein [Helicobacter cinaedi]
MAEYYEYGLVGLFVVCFVASTLYPLGSEAFVVGFMAMGFDALAVWSVASLGNTLGSLSTYYLAYFGGYKMIMRFFPKAWDKISTLAPKIQKYGFVYAFFVFLPFVGDVFALALGLVRYRQILCVLGIALGKMARYALLVVPFVL